ncbi:MAG: RNA polymerase sigma factor [Prevotella sp.]
MNHDNNKQQTIGHLYEVLRSDLQKYFFAAVHNTQDAEDMVQDLFIKVLGLDIMVEETARQVIFVMARRMIIDHYRHRQIVRDSWDRIFQQESQYITPSPERRIEAADLLHLEQQHTFGMPYKRALVYHLYHHENMSTEEISVEMGLSRRTVESHIYTATKEMRHYLRNII